MQVSVRLEGMERERRKVLTSKMWPIIVKGEEKEEEIWTATKRTHTICSLLQAVNAESCILFCYLL